jgi:hypothetical protein
MLPRRRRLAASLLAIGLLAATLFAVDALALPRPAEARCDGINNPIRSTFSLNGYVRASERAAIGTCNGNNDYVGFLTDEFADGYCVGVQFKEAGYNWVFAAGGQVCGTGNTSYFEWTDLNRNSNAYQRFCIWPKSDPAVKICGWGTRTGDNYYGVNHGF